MADGESNEPEVPEEQPEAEAAPASSEEGEGEPRPSEDADAGTGEAEPAREDAGGPSLDELAAQIRAIRIGEFLLTTTSTLASLAYAKIEARELDEARGAIDAIGALLPVLEGRVDDQLRRDFERALTNLRLAYADAASGASS